MDGGRFRDDVLALLRAEPWAQDDVVDRVAAALRPVVGLRFVPTVNDDDADTPVPLGASKVGGLPHVPPGFDWPMEVDGDQPLTLVCQINLAEVARAVPSPLPQTGMLYLFSIADGDRAYGYEIDDTTTALLYEPDTGELTLAPAPDEFASDEYEGEGVLKERLLQVGPSFVLEAPDDDDEGAAPTEQRFDYDIERAVKRAIEAAGGTPAGVARMFGNAYLFREEMQEEYDPVRQTLLLTVDGYAVDLHSFGEGTFHVLIDRDALAAGDLTKTELIFEPGT